MVATGSTLKSLIVATIAELLDQLPEVAVVAIDVPIGLPSNGSRICDVESRRRLGPKRGSSVFPAAVRSVLTARDYSEACSIHVVADGRKMSQQAFAILPKIREVDDLLQTSSRARSIVREVHPEVTFTIWNDGEPMSSPKKKAQGRLEREALIDAMWPGVRALVSEKLPRGQVKRDDVNDAFAALWTAKRIADGNAIRVPEQTFFDAMGLPMQIWA